MKVSVLLCLLSISPTPHKGVALLLDGSLIPCHLPLPASRELVGVGLWEGWRGLERDFFCSSKLLLLLLLKENGVHVVDCDSEVLCNARRALRSRRTVSVEAPLTISLPRP
jgi:hypothetical protein